MRTLIAMVAELFLSDIATAQKTVSFPTEDGGVVSRMFTEPARELSCLPRRPFQRRELDKAGFQTDQGERLMHEIVRFLSAKK